MLEFIQQPWPWYVAGPVIAFTMFMLLYFGNNFGLSANLRTACSMLGAGKKVKLFDFNWKEQSWNLVFALGTVIGGFIAHQFLSPDTAVAISESTVNNLKSLGITDPGADIAPMELFSFDALLSIRGLIMLIGGGFLIGFGTRYAGGCTSGHAISGLSDLQPASLVAVIGFFIGGLIMTHFLLPHILTL